MGHDFFKLQIEVGHENFKDILGGGGCHYNFQCQIGDGNHVYLYKNHRWGTQTLAFK